MPYALKTAIIPVAGLGTRLLPISKSIPKEMVPVVDRPIIQHVVDEALAAGFSEIVFVTRAGKSAIEDHFTPNDAIEAELEDKGKTALLNALKLIVPPQLKVTSVRQNRALGLGHAVLCASHLVNPNEPFAVILPDVLVKPPLGADEGDNDLKKMARVFKQSEAAQIMVDSVPMEQVSQYGIVDCGGNPAAGKSLRLKGLVEKPAPEEAPSQLSAIGRYILPGEIMQLLAQTQPGAGGEIQLTDAIAALIAKGGVVHAYRMNGRTFDCGYIQGWLQANAILGREAGLID